MSSHSNVSQAHDFYYKGVDLHEEHSYSKCSLSYEQNKAISYSTTVALVIPRKGVRDTEVTTTRPQTGLTLLSYFSMSATTSKHICDLRHASPFEVVELPFERGDRFVTPERLRDLLLKELAYYATCLNQAHNRRHFVCLMDARQKVLNLACETWAKPFRDKRFKAYEKIDVSKAAAELQAKHRQEASKRAAETKRIFATYVKDRRGKDYLEFLRVLFDPDYASADYPLSRDERSLLRAKVGKSDAAYVWIDGDKVVTSRHVKVDLREAHAALMAWGLGKDMRTVKVGYYTILSYTGDTIRIGCHHIPRTNMVALYEAVVGKPFPNPQEAKAA